MSERWHWEGRSSRLASRDEAHLEPLEGEEVVPLPSRVDVVALKLGQRHRLQRIKFPSTRNGMFQSVS